MPRIIPIRDLKNTAAISKMCSESKAVSYTHLNSASTYAQYYGLDTSKSLKDVYKRQVEHHVADGIAGDLDGGEHVLHVGQGRFLMNQMGRHKRTPSHRTPGGCSDPAA